MSEKTKNSWDKISFIQRLKNVKHLELIIIAIFVVVLGVIFLSSSNAKKEITGLNEASLEEYATYLENKLETVIKQIKGVGSAYAMLTFDGRITYEYAKEKEEVTTSNSVGGGTNSKTTTNEKVIVVTQNGKSGPLIVKEIYPDISGVVIVASGAESVDVRLNIISAVETVLGVSANKIQVLSGKN